MDRLGIQGYVSPGFDAVREAFAENFVRRRELGGACCAFHRGEKTLGQKIRGAFRLPFPFALD